MGIDTVMITRRKQTRGAILMLLWRNQDTRIAIDTLENVLLEAHPYIRSDLPPVLNYLADKGYIDIAPMEPPQLIPLRGAMVRLTSKGVDLVEESIPDDPGVIFGDGNRA